MRLKMETKTLWTNFELLHERIWWGEKQLGLQAENLVEGIAGIEEQLMLVCPRCLLMTSHGFFVH